jgi:hypothetical protein
MKKTLATKKPRFVTPTGASRLVTIVELRGLEPPTFRMRTERSPIELQPPAKNPLTNREYRISTQPFSDQLGPLAFEALQVTQSGRELKQAHPTASEPCTRPKPDVRHSDRSNLRLNIERNAERVNRFTRIGFA